MSIRQIMKSKAIICTVPDERKAAAVRDTILNEISPACPATILRTHAKAVLLMDLAAASLVRDKI